MRTIFYAAKVTSNDPVLSRINPIAVRTLPSAMRGRNIQYFLRIAAIARSCSARSVRKRALPSNVSPPMDSLIFGVFWTLRTHWRFTIRGANIELIVIQNEPNRDFVGLPGLASIMCQGRGLLARYLLQSLKCVRFHKLSFGNFNINQEKV